MHEFRQESMYLNEGTIRGLPSDRLFIVFLDCDGTLTLSEGSWAALHQEYNTEAVRDRLLKDYINNTITFDEWVYRTAETWKGNDASAIKKAFHNTRLANEYCETVVSLKSLGAMVGIVSAGVEQFVELVGKKANVDFVVGNSLKVSDGEISGDVDIKVTDKNKVKIYKKIQEEVSIPVNNMVMVGDSVYDVEKAHDQNLNIAFNYSDEKVKKHAEVAIQDTNLSQILPPIIKWNRENFWQ